MCGIPSNVCNEIWGIINHRWQQFFISGPTNVHLSAFYLNPSTYHITYRALPPLTWCLGYVRSTIFKNPNPLTFSIRLPAKEPAKIPPGIRSPRTFIEVGRYLLTLLVDEINHGEDRTLIAWKDRPAAFTRAYQAQFTAYAQGAYPFNTPLGKEQDPLNWWQAYEGTTNAGILAVSLHFDAYRQANSPTLGNCY
jgi:hypothetical protein